ncbi:MAG: hypothetical protein AAGD86_03440, partial [Pseudomonadota bacterium]
MTRSYTRPARAVACFLLAGFAAGCADDGAPTPPVEAAADAAPEAPDGGAAAPIDGGRDYHSYAKPDSVFVSHIDLELDVV